MMTEGAPKIRHEWFQTESSVTLDVFIRNLKPDQVSVEYTPGSVSVCVKTAASSETMLDFSLWQDINPQKCTHEVLSTKIEVSLAKSLPGIKWAALEGDGRDALAGVMAQGEGKAPAYPSSARNKKDWASVEHEISKAPEEGEKQLNDFFKDIFKGATPEVRNSCHVGMYLLTLSISPTHHTIRGSASNLTGRHKEPCKRASLSQTAPVCQQTGICFRYRL